MPKFNLKINNETHTVEADMDTPLLWVLRDQIDLVGTKYGCGIGQCGACTVHVNGNAVRSCLLQVSQAEGMDITTIEGGYCQSGQIMSAAALLKNNPSPSDGDIDATMNGNICRCGTYIRIKQAIKTASNF